ncbi:MAG: hypothetical protein AB7T49_16085 [Oligoflexales bacterium]
MKTILTVALATILTATAARSAPTVSDIWEGLYSGKCTSAQIGQNNEREMRLLIQVFEWNGSNPQLGMKLLQTHHYTELGFADEYDAAPANGLWTVECGTAQSQTTTSPLGSSTSQYTCKIQQDAQIVSFAEQTISYTNFTEPTHKALNKATTYKIERTLEKKDAEIILTSKYILLDGQQDELSQKWFNYSCSFDLDSRRN